MVDCGLKRIAALAGLGWIADCTLGTLQWKDVRPPLRGVLRLHCRLGAKSPKGGPPSGDVGTDVSE
eukprot:3657405-Alexandrium_andersonii.AAC.1